MRKRDRKRRAMFRMVARFEASGLTWREFARRRGISISTLSYWRRKAAVEGKVGGECGGPQDHSARGGEPEDRSAQVEASLVPLSVVLGTNSMEAQRRSFEIVLTDGRRVVVPEDFSTEGLRRLLEVVGC